MAGYYILYLRNDILINQVKDELQNIIIGNGQDGPVSQIKKMQYFLRGNEKAGSKPEKEKRIKSKGAAILLRKTLRI